MGAETFGDAGKARPSRVRHASVGSLGHPPFVPPATSEVLLFVIEAGGGHRAAANALVAAAQQTGRPWSFREVKLQEALAGVDFTRRLTGLSMEAAYNAMIRRRWTRFLAPMLRMLHAVIALFHGRLVAELARQLAPLRPLAAVSVLPNFNGVIRDALRAAHPGVPFLVLLTDFADFPPHFWIEPGVERVIVGSDEAVRQARALGLPAERISRSSGMVLHPRFYPRPGPETRTRVRSTLDFTDADFVVLVLFGGQGSPEMRPLVETLLARSPDWRVIAICGDNPALFASLQPAEAAAAGRLRRLGFTDRVSDYLAACDVLVSKPGPGTLAEAFHQRVPAVVTHDARTIPQERFNARLVESQGLGLAVRHWRDAPAAVARLAGDPDLGRQVRRRLAELPENRAVYEALDVIERELHGRGSQNAA
jgi:1,2-diacylglycerol 3-beta-galactosyltransferase